VNKTQGKSVYKAHNINSDITSLQTLRRPTQFKTAWLMGKLHYWTSKTGRL